MGRYWVGEIICSLAVSKEEGRRRYFIRWCKRTAASPRRDGLPHRRAAPVARPVPTDTAAIGELLPNRWAQTHPEHVLLPRASKSPVPWPSSAVPPAASCPQTTHPGLMGISSSRCQRGALCYADIPRKNRLAAGGKHGTRQNPRAVLEPENLRDLSRIRRAALEPAGAEASEHELENAKIAFTVWNAVVLDAVDHSRGWLDQVWDLAGHDPRVRALVEQLIARKQRLFGNDHRLIGKYQLFRRQGELRLQAEARQPRPRR